jgi:hypothetical protein
MRPIRRRWTVPILTFAALCRPFRGSRTIPIIGLEPPLRIPAPGSSEPEWPVIDKNGTACETRRRISGMNHLSSREGGTCSDEDASPQHWQS